MVYNKRSLVRSMLSEIVAIFNRGIFVQCLTCGVTLCIVGYRILIVSVFKTKLFRKQNVLVNHQQCQADMFSNDFFAMILLLSGFLGEIFYYCHYGNEIKLKSQRLSEALYSCRWYEFRCVCSQRYSRSHRRVLMTSIAIIMERLKRPAIVQAGNLLDLTYDTFIAVRQTDIYVGGLFDCVDCVADLPQRLPGVCRSARHATEMRTTTTREP